MKKVDRTSPIFTFPFASFPESRDDFMTAFDETPQMDSLSNIFLPPPKKIEQINYFRMLYFIIVFALKRGLFPIANS